MFRQSRCLLKIFQGLLATIDDTRKNNNIVLIFFDFWKKRTLKSKKKKDGTCKIEMNTQCVLHIRVDRGFWKGQFPRTVCIRSK
jgi:hypothetical protein